MYKTFSELGFKAGDKVRCTYSECDGYEEGMTFTLEEIAGDARIGNGNYDGRFGDWELVESVTYEDQWHLNDGSPIPEGADTLEKDGSVVAYRKIKENEVKEYTDRVYVDTIGTTYSVQHAGTTPIRITSTFTDGVLTDVKADIV